MRDFPNNDSTPPKSTNQSELRWPFVLTAVNAAHKIKAAERFRSIKIAPSFNGRTADSGSAYRGSNPWGAANLFNNFHCTQELLWGLLWGLESASSSACSRFRSS